MNTKRQDSYVLLVVSYDIIFYAVSIHLLNVTAGHLILLFGAGP